MEIINVMLGGYGVSYLPEYTVRKHLKEGTLVQINVKDIGVDLYSFYLCSRNRWINPVMQAFLDIVNPQMKVFRKNLSEFSPGIDGYC